MNVGARYLNNMIGKYGTNLGYAAYNLGEKKFNKQKDKYGPNWRSYNNSNVINNWFKNYKQTIK